MKKIQDKKPVLPADYWHAVDADYGYSSYESWDWPPSPLPPSPPPVHNPYQDHRCTPMVEHQTTRNQNKRARDRIAFTIRYTVNGWRLIGEGISVSREDTEGMPVVQCPFCHQRMFVGNQVTIE
jgi:hypothetical protein